MRLVLTGGAGYVGSACLRWLLARGHDAIAYDDLSAGNRAAVPAGRLVVGDILDGARLAALLREPHADAVLHFAALASVPESIEKPELYWRINVAGTKSVLDAAVAARVERFVFSSTAATYSFAAPMPLDEDADQRPETPYGTTKLAGEAMIRDYARASGFAYGILRYFNAAGADTDGAHGEARAIESHLIPLVFRALAGRQKRLSVYGGKFPTRDGTCVRDYVHVEDLAQAHELAVMKLAGTDGLVYNIGSGTGSTVLEVIRAAEEVTGSRVPHEVVAPRPGDPAVLVASSERIRRELGWKPRYPDVRSIVATAWRWHESHPDGYTSRASSS